MTKRILLAALVWLAATAAAWAQAGQLPAWNVLGNPTSGPLPARAAPLTTMLDGAFCSTSGQVLQRGVSAWNCASVAGPGGSSGQVQTNNGSGGFNGLTNTQLTALINLATASLPGALPAWPNTTTTYFRGDGTYQTLNFAAIGGTASVGQLPADSTIWRTATTTDTILNTDCWKTVEEGTGSSGFFSVTLPSVSGFPAGCRVSIKNGDTGRGKLLSGITGVTNNILWPGQSVSIQIINGAWTVTDAPGRWQITSNVNFYVDSSLGSDTNDCLASGAGACASASKAVNLINGGIDFGANQSGCAATVNVPGTLSMDAAHVVAVAGPFVGIASSGGAAAVCIDGNSTGSLNPTTNFAAVSSTYGGNIQVQNVTINVPNGGVGLVVHFGGRMSAPNVTIIGAATAVNAIFVSDNSFFYASSTTIGFGGTFSGYVVETLNNSTAIFESTTTTIVSNLTDLGFVHAEGLSTQQWGGSFVTGGHTVTGIKFLIEKGGNILGNSDGTTNYFPGTGVAVHGIRNYDALPMVDLSNTTDGVFNQAGVASGGTGNATLTAHGLVVGQGTSPTSSVGPCATSGQIFIGAGSSADPACGSQKMVFSGYSSGGGNAVVCAQNATCWFWMTGTNTSNEASIRGIVPYAGTFRNFYAVSAGGAPPSGQTFVLTLRVNNSSTSITCTITSSGNSCSDLADTATITAGQTVDIQVVASATSGNGAFNWGLEFDTP